MADLTIEQRKALAMAAARLRLKQRQALPEPKNQSRLGMVEEAMPEGQAPNIGLKGEMRPDDRVQPDLTNQAARAATFDLGDEAVAGMMLPIERTVNAISGEGPTDPSEIWQQLRAKQNAQQAATNEQMPGLSTAASVAGGLATAPAQIGRVIQGGNLLTKTGRGAMAGAGMGAAIGFGSGGEGLEQRQEGAQSGALGGGIVGAVVPPAASAAGKLVQKFVPSEV